MSIDVNVNELSDTCKMRIKHEFQGINKVYEYRKLTNIEATLCCSETLHKLYVLLTNVGNLPEDNKETNYATHYLANHNILTSRLVQVIADSEDMRLCSYAVEILHTLLSKKDEIFEKDIKVLRRNLNVSTNYLQLLESIYTINVRFCNTTCEDSNLLELQFKLLLILAAINETKISRELYLNVSTNTVRFLGTLLSTACNKNTKLLCNLLPLLNVLCHKKRNCEILASAKFFDSLNNAFNLTKRILTVVSILKAMARNELALHCLSYNENIFKLLLDLLNYSGKKNINKRSVITILYRITKTEQGLEILKNDDNCHRLLDWFTKNQNCNNFQNKMTAIKVYTILNRTITKVTLNPKPVVNLSLSYNMTDAASSSEESDCENDSEEENHGPHTNIELHSQFNLPALSRTLEYLPEMQSYFDELFDCKSASKLEIFENIAPMSGDDTSWKNIIEQRIHRNSLNNKYSYPDSENQQEELDEHCLSCSSYDLNLEFLLHKLKSAKGTEPSTFTPKIVYEFHKDCSQNCSSTTLIFDSHFECGNLNTVIQINEFEYDLILSPDTGSYKGLQWFYFKISNIKLGVCYVLNIVNFMKVNSQYNYGMQPLLFSANGYKLNGIGWKRAGENVTYFGNNYTNHNGSRQYRTLSFSVSFKYANDCVYFAYHYPYTYTRLMTMLYPISSNNSNNIYKRVDKLCNTINNNELPLLTITAAGNKSNFLKIPITKRPIILITARVHPGETNSSWITEGMIKFLLDENNEEACKIREYFIFKIIPMLNVEGVIYGNTRCGIYGNDLNRCWANPNKKTCPEIYHTKKLVEYIKKGLKQDVSAYIDIHGHSRKKFFFFYGCNPKLSWNQEDWKQKDCLEALKVLPQLTSKLNPHIRLNLCRYRIERNRESTARVIMWREFGIQNSYTLECSYCSGDNNQMISTKILTEIGANVIAALGMMHEKYLQS